MSRPARQVAELRAAESIGDRDARWAKEKTLVLRIRHEADPRGADALASYLLAHKDWKRSAERVHFETEAAFALAELGDLRALPVLAERMRLEPRQVYARGDGPEALLRLDDRERSSAARLIADLATLHPEALARIRTAAAQPVFAWVTSTKQSAAEGMRALAAMHVTTPIRDRIRVWAEPPGPGHDAPVAWSKVQSALQCVGALHDAKSWPILLEQIQRPTMEYHVHGAVDGLWEWGDPKAFDALLGYVDSKDGYKHTDDRMEACSALAWVATKRDAPELAKRISRWAAATKKMPVPPSCLLSGLQIRKVDGLSTMLLGLISDKVSSVTRLLAARALGRNGVDSATQQKLEKLLADPELRVDAALALLLGGSTKAARRGVQALPAKQATSKLADLYSGSFSYVSDVDFADGHMYRWVDNALALLHIPRPRAVQVFARTILSRQLQNVLFDDGPHSLSRVVLRYRLRQAAESGPAATRPEAVATLALMRERGTLRALAAGTGKASGLARAALARLGAPAAGE